MNRKPIVLFDLDGTVRATRQFVYPRAHQVTLYPGIIEMLMDLRRRGFLLAGITNQGGIATGVITEDEVRAAVARTQELLGEAAFDFVTFCPHHFQADGRYCDCKKPAPGLALDVLTALPGGTLQGGFVVGDDLQADAGVAQCLSMPFVEAVEFRNCKISVLLQRLLSAKPMLQLSGDKAAGVLVGMAVGDAIGAAVEFWPRTRVKAAYTGGVKEMRSSPNWAKGEYTDDTQMALLLAGSLMARHSFDPTDVAQRFCSWAMTAKDVGVQISRVIRMPGYCEQPEIQARIDYRKHPSGAAGNGAVMRSAPIALFHQDSPSMLLADSRRNARVTHGDPKAQSSCVLVNCAIDHFLHGGDLPGALQAGYRHLTSIETAVWARLESIATIPEEDISSSGYTVSTVEAAFWSLLRSSSFEEAVVTAASLGDDADTVAAVTGAMAGAYYGYSAIPDRWKEILENEPQIRALALQLAKTNSTRTDA